MIISILVPVKNWFISELIHKLAKQICFDGLSKSIDLVIVDDGSSKDYLISNEIAVNAVRAMGVNCLYVINDVNLGRSKVRNLLMSKSSANYLLFLDADVMPDDDEFVKKYYLCANNSDHDIICGGISYNLVHLTSDRYNFYLKQGQTVSVASSDLRNLNPWQWLFTANVMVKRATLAAVPFGDNFVAYGYEDIEWGIRLSKFTKIHHTDNTVSHLGLLDKVTYRKKMIESIQNLKQLTILHPSDSKKLRVVKWANAMTFLPAATLYSLSKLFGRLFISVNNFYFLENICFQMEKCSLAAFEFKRSKI